MQTPPWPSSLTTLRRASSACMACRTCNQAGMGIIVGAAFQTGICARVRRCVRYRRRGIGSVGAARDDPAFLAPGEVERCPDRCHTSAVENGERNSGPAMKAGLKRIVIALGLIVVLVPAGYYAWAGTIARATCKPPMTQRARRDWQLVVMKNLPPRFCDGWSRHLE